MRTTLTTYTTIVVSHTFSPPFCYNKTMYNWDYPKTAKQDIRWRLERLCTYGLNNEKIDKKLLQDNLLQLRIPDNTRAFLELILWNKPF